MAALTTYSECVASGHGLERAPCTDDPATVHEWAKASTSKKDRLDSRQPILHGPLQLQDHLICPVTDSEFHRPIRG